MSDPDRKTARLVEFAHRTGLGGVLLGTPPNVAWLTGGGSNRIDLTREPGAGALFIGRDGRWSVLANAIEMPRLLTEVVGDRASSHVSCPWPDERANPGWMVEAAQQLVNGSPIGADWPATGAVPVDVAPLRVPLTDEEIARVRTLGRDAGRVVADVCRSLTPGMTEQAIANRVIASVAMIDARSLVTLVGADARLLVYRHPFPTETAWHDVVMVATCIERHGLVVALSRFVSAGAPSDTFRRRMTDTASVFGALLRATIPGATGADLYRAAAAAYTTCGVPGEELRHHQGGAIGYRGRDWVAHPASRDQVRLPQTFAWNPSITGTKVEDTALVTNEGIELVTTSADWPTLPIDVRGQTLGAADVWVAS